VADSALGRGVLSMSPSAAGKRLTETVSRRDKTAYETAPQVDVDIRISKITGGVGKKEIKRILDAISPDIEACFRAHAPGITRPMRLALKLDQKGTVVEIKFDVPSGRISAKLKKCLRMAFEKASFPAAADQRPYELEVEVKRTGQ